MPRRVSALTSVTAYSASAERQAKIVTRIRRRGQISPAYKPPSSDRCCQAHTAANAGHLGAPEEKVAVAWEFETSNRFTEAERAALRLARDAGLSPNATTPAHFEELRRHYTERQIVDLAAIVNLFGFLNRWNDTMATELEDVPAAFGRRVLAARGWQVGKHS